MKKFVLILTLLQLVSFFAQSDSKIDDFKFFQKYDFSSALKPKTKFLGFIEPNYKRLRIEFNSVTKAKDQPSNYEIQGKTQVNSSKCLFKGNIKFNKIERYPSPQMHYGADEEAKSLGIKEEGQIFGTYEFSEKPNTKSCGIFKGSITLNYFLDKEGNFQYDDIEADVSDNFRNNQYEGTWQAYDGSKSKKANWGEYRIPDSDDLDKGAGDFGPNPKYLKSGWEDFNR